MSSEERSRWLGVMLGLIIFLVPFGIYQDHKRGLRELELQEFVKNNPALSMDDMAIYDGLLIFIEHSNLNLVKIHRKMTVDINDGLLVRLDPCVLNATVVAGGIGHSRFDFRKVREQYLKIKALSKNPELIPAEFEAETK